MEQERVIRPIDVTKHSKSTDIGTQISHSVRHELSINPGNRLRWHHFRNSSHLELGKIKTKDEEGLYNAIIGVILARKNIQGDETTIGFTPNFEGGNENMVTLSIYLRDSSDPKTNP